MAKTKKGVAIAPNMRNAIAYKAMFWHFNQKLFAGNLMMPMLTMTRDPNALRGYHATDTWHDDDGNLLSEISLNANAMNDDVWEMANVLIHEMVHLWQHQYGTPKPGWHNEEFAEYCESIQLGFKNDRTGQFVQTFIEPNGIAWEAIKTLPEDAIFPWMSQDIGTSEPPKWHPPKGMQIIIQIPGGSGGNQNDNRKGDGRSQGNAQNGDGQRAKGGKQETQGNVPPPPKIPKDRTVYACPICGLQAWTKPGKSLMCGECGELLVEGR